MNRINKIICFILVSFFFISGVFAQTSFLTPTIPISNSFSTHSEEAAIKTSDVNGDYDFGDGNTMDIDAIDNTTTTTITNTTSGDIFTIESEKTETSVSTIECYENNDTMTITSDSENIVLVEVVNGSNPLHRFDLSLTDKSQSYVRSTVLTGEAFELYSNAILDDENDLLDSFYANAVYSGGYINVTYLKDDLDGYDLNILPSGQDTNINYDDEANEFKWNDKTHKNLPYVGNRFTSEYTINNSGVWEDNTQVIDWTTPDLQTYSYRDVYQINITKFYDTIEIHYSTFVAPGAVGLETNLYQLVFTRTYTGIIVMDYELSGFNVRLHWQNTIISIYFPVAPPHYTEVIFQLRDIVQQLYVIFFEATNFRGLFFRNWNEFILYDHRMAIGFIQNYIDIHIGFGIFWIGYRFDIMQNLFIGYEIQIRYLTWLYIFYVPTLILPNLLTINILQIIYNRKSLDITIKVTEQFGFDITGATITGTWDGTLIGPLSDNGDGIYSFSLPAKGKFTKILSLTASMTGFANGILNVEITVKSPGGSSKTSNDGSGLSEKDFLGLYLLAIVSTIATVFIGKYFGVPKTLGITKYFNKKKYQRNKL